MNKPLIFTAEIQGNKTKINLKINLIQFKDNGGYIIYSPETEVYGYGNTVSEAKESFKISLLEFIRYSTNKGTFFKEMKRMGWKIRKSKKQIKMTIPVFTEILSRNNNLKEIVNEREYKVFKENIPLAIPV